MNLFLWLSGADQKILDQCEDLKDSEKIKFIGFGTTVIIPAIFGCFAAGYAVSTFIDEPIVYLCAGIVWFFTVAAIDRFLVSSLHKRSDNKKGFWASLSLRLFIAIIFGIVISHPLVLFIFRESIENQINTTHSLEFTENAGTLETRRKLLYKPILDDIASYESKERCLQTLLSYEQSGVAQTAYDDKGKPCGSSSGKQGVSIFYANIQRQLKDTQDKIEELKNELNNNSQPIAYARESLTEEFNKGANYDYLARTKALQKLTEKENHVWWVHFLLTLFLLLIDSLLVTLKATTPMGRYEIELEKATNISKELAEIEMNAIRKEADDIYSEVASFRLKTKVLKEKVEHIRGIPEEFTQKEAERMEKFNDAVSKIKNPSPEILTNLNDMFQQAFIKAVSAIKDFLSIKK